MTGYRPRLSEDEQRILHNYRNSELRTYLVLFDLHIPFHDKEIIPKIYKLGEYLGKNINGLVLAGDFLELFTLGSYNADSLEQLKNITLSYEYQEGNKVLDRLEESFPNLLEKHFIYGNHEDRYKREVKRGDTAKYGEALESPEKALKLESRGYTILNNWMEDYVKLGRDLYVMHGLSCAKYCAANNFRDFNEASLMTGHTHREQTYREGNKASYSIGGLFDKASPTFRYMAMLKRNHWSNGFALVHVDQFDNTFVDVINVTPSKSFIVQGKLF